MALFLNYRNAPYFTAYFSCAEAWGLDVYAPKTISILIRFYSENSGVFEKNRFIVKEYPELFQRLVDYHFANSSHEVREQFLKACKDTNIEGFLDKIRLAEEIIQKNGATYVGDSREVVTSIWADGDCLSEKRIQRIWQKGDEYIRVDKMYFQEKPFIVLEFAENPNGPYEDADPIPYDLPDDEFEQEIKEIL